MSSHAKTVTEYMQKVPSKHLDDLTELREICLQTLHGFKESMEFGIPSYSCQKQVAVAWSSQKDHIHLQVFTDQILKNHKAELKHLDVNKFTIGYHHLSADDLIQIKKLLTEVVEYYHGRA